MTISHQELTSEQPIRHSAQGTAFARLSNRLFTWLDTYPHQPLALVLLLSLLLGVACIITNPPSNGLGGTGNWWPLVLNLAHGRGYTFCQPQYFPFCKATSQVTASR